MSEKGKPSARNGLGTANMDHRKKLSVYRADISNVFSII